MARPQRRILIVDDDALLANLAKESLEKNGFIAECAQDAAQGRKKVSSFDPDLILLDLALGPGPSGVHLAHALSAKRPDIGILVLTKYANVQAVNPDFDDLPADVGFVRKQHVSDPKLLIAAIEQVLADQSSEVRDDWSPSRPFADLPPRALTILRLLAEGLSNPEIARRANISVKSVERWTDRIYRQLELPADGTVNLRVAAARKYLKEIGGVEGM
jgi:two-component system, NarL family, invasion response regulator UvrY